MSCEQEAVKTLMRSFDWCSEPTAGRFDFQEALGSLDDEPGAGNLSVFFFVRLLKFPPPSGLFSSQGAYVDCFHY